MLMNVQLKLTEFDCVVIFDEFPITEAFAKKNWLVVFSDVGIRKNLVLFGRAGSTSMELFHRARSSMLILIGRARLRVWTIISMS